MRKLPDTYPLYDTVYGSEIPSEQFFVHIFDLIPSKRVTQQDYDETIIDFFKEDGFVEECFIFSMMTVSNEK